MLSSSITPKTEKLTHSWQWQTWQGLPYLTCSLLQNWQHGFFTQHFYPRHPDELVAVFQPLAPVYRLHQVHGNQIVTPKEILAQQIQNNSLYCADGIITEAANQSVWVASADCCPVLIADELTGRVSAVHAGWRGTAAGIVSEAIALFVNYGSSLENLRLAIGPAISGQVYQVSEEVAKQVCATIVLPEKVDQEITNSPLLDDPELGKVKIDLPRVICLQAQQLGINLVQIAIAPYCTYQQAEYFFSYRRLQEKKVQWSGIISQYI